MQAEGRRPTGCRRLGEQMLKELKCGITTVAFRIEGTFRVRNFREAFALVQQVGELAEAEGHHPDISFGWGYVTVVIQTKKIKGLHENDFIMAAKIDRLFKRADG
ncbi:MAG TPA: 4a-hydroxytetrahydrobiopterin dehydratase [Casimicrobiaceae bacterium]|nr:4a-hydroxytetrahydrobiopterin dehydratase [Casimicrobiaceae bacterium]